MPPADPLDKTHCSLLILLATTSEADGLREAAGHLDLPFESLSHPDLGRYFWFGRVGSERVIASLPWREGGRVVMGSHGRLGTAARGIYLRDETGAQGIIQLGMAFGVDPGSQCLGDVLVSSSLIPYDDRIVLGDRTDPRSYRNDYQQAHPRPARQLIVDLFRAEKERTSRTYQVHIGAILSGAARVQSRAFRDELVFGVPRGKEQVVGGEMEGVGLLAASTATNKPIWCIVKGISDFADEDRDTVIEQGRRLACRNAAEFVLAALQNAPFNP